MAGAAADINFSAIDSRVLNAADLKDVLEELAPIAESRADNMGIALGLSAGSFEPTMESVVEKWLDQDYNTKRYQLPSYRRLVKAVASRVGGSNLTLAKEIAAKHPGAVGIDDFASISQPIVEPLQFPNFQVIRTDGDDELSDDSYFRPYQMNQSPHGLCLIINNKYFKGKSTRDGAEVDQKSVSRLFGPRLGYKLYKGEAQEDQTAKDMVSLVKKVAEADHSKYDSVVLFLASHGDEECLYGTDNRPMLIEQIQDILTDCKTLVGKPKIIFIQACRGSQRPDGKEVQEDGDDNKNLFIPRDSDFFFGYATTPNTKACRFESTGSWYVIELCRVMERYYAKFDLHRMVTAVHCRVATKPEYLLEGTDKETQKKYKYKQCPQIVTTLTRPVFFGYNYMPQ